MTEKPFRTEKFIAANSSGTANLETGRLVAGSLVVNGSGIYTPTMNVSAFAVGTATTANSTLTNVAAFNVVNQLNTDTFYATTSIPVGANVSVTPGTLFIGNSTVNTVVNTAMINPDDKTITTVGTTIGTTSTNAVVNTTQLNFSGGNLVANTTTVNTGFIGISNTRVTVTDGTTSVYEDIATGIFAGNSTSNTKISGNVEAATIQANSLLNDLGHPLCPVTIYSGNVSATSLLYFDLASFTKYTHFEVYLSSIFYSADNSQVLLRVSNSSANISSSIYGSVYRGGWFDGSVTWGTTVAGGDGATSADISQDADLFANNRFNCTFMIYSFFNTSYFKYGLFQSAGYTGGNTNESWEGAFSVRTLDALTGIQLRPTTGTFSTNYIVYGYRG